MRILIVAALAALSACTPTITPDQIDLAAEIAKRVVDSLKEGGGP